MKKGRKQLKAREGSELKKEKNKKVKFGLEKERKQLRVGQGSRRKNEKKGESELQTLKGKKTTHG